MSRADDATVYSSDQGRICAHCGLPQKRCVCRANPRKTAPRGDGRVRVGRESKGRRGKTVSTVSGLALPEAELKQLAKELKQFCGTGGALKDGIIEIQGDHRDKLVDELQRRGIEAKRSGG